MYVLNICCLRLSFLIDRPLISTGHGEANRESRTIKLAGDILPEQGCSLHRQRKLPTRRLFAARRRNDSTRGRPTFHRALCALRARSVPRRIFLQAGLS